MTACNTYKNEQDVYLDVGAKDAQLKPGDYYFAVVDPSGPGNDPSDTAVGNLSVLYDTKADRTFSIDAAGTVTTVGGHAIVDNKIQLLSFAQTSNPGGEYKVLVCPVGGPVSARKSDTFKIPLIKAAAPTPVAEDVAWLPITSVLASGTITDDQGVPVAGTTVEALVWPEPDSLANTEVGDELSPQAIATTTTDALGNYVLSADGVNLLPSGQITELEFVAMASGAPAVWFTELDTTTMTIESDGPDESASSLARSAHWLWHMLPGVGFGGS